jgi:hypothetical protein
MNKKIIGIIVCVLLISIPVLSVTGTIDTKKIGKTSYEHDPLEEQIINMNCVQSDWSEDKLTASDAASDDYFGCSVSIDGEYAIVGARGDESYRGAAYIFKRSGTTWTQEQKLTASDGATGDNFGCSVSIDGEYGIIGSRYSDSYKGSAYIFKRSGTTWTQEQKLTASDGAAWDYFGDSVSIDGDYVIIGAYQDDGTGSAYVFKRSGSTWTQEQKLTASDGVASDFFGQSVSIDGKYVIIGAFGDDSNKGSAYIFKYDGTTWTQEQKLTASDGAAWDYFGESVAIYETYGICGATGDDDNGSFSGSAYVFKGPVPNLDCVGSLSWDSVIPESTVTDEFVLANVGEAGSELSWEIESYPTWGNWTFIPSKGTGLTPEMGSVTIYVEVVAPNQQNQEFTGDIKVINSEDVTDYDIIPVTLKTPKNKTFSFNPPLLKWLFERFPNAFPILRQFLDL